MPRKPDPNTKCIRCGRKIASGTYYCGPCKVEKVADRAVYKPSMSHGPSSAVREFQAAWWPSRGESWAEYEARIGRQPIDVFCEREGL
jgi:hypothetical protein